MEKKIINAEDLLKNRSPEQILNLLEAELKNLIQQKKSFKANFQNKFQEIEQKLRETKIRISEFQKNLQEIEKEQKDNEEWFRIE